MGSSHGCVGIVNVGVRKGMPASATVHALPNCEYYSWDLDQVDAIKKKSKAAALAAANVWENAGFSQVGSRASEGCETVQNVEKKGHNPD